MNVIKWGIEQHSDAHSSDKVRIYGGNHKYLSSNFSEYFARNFTWSSWQFQRNNLTYLKTLKKNMHTFYQKYKFYPGKFGTSRMFIRRSSLARQSIAPTFSSKEILEPAPFTLWNGKRAPSPISSLQREGLSQRPREPCSPYKPTLSGDHSKREIHPHIREATMWPIRVYVYYSYA